MLLQAFIDDSATTNPQQPFFTLAGFISTYDNWANFSIAWQAELDKTPSIKCFKMNQAFVKKGPFKGWNTLDVEKRVAEFIKIIKSFAMVRVSCSINKEDYNNYIKGWVPKEIDNPYFICFYNLIIAILAFQRRYRLDTQIDFIFDVQGKLGQKTNELYYIVDKIAPKQARKYIGSPPIFKDDKEVLPLQAADLYAWLIRRHLFENKIIIMPMRPELKALHDMQNIERHINAKTISEIMTELAKQSH